MQWRNTISEFLLATYWDFRLPSSSTSLRRESGYDLVTVRLRSSLICTVAFNRLTQHSHSLSMQFSSGANYIGRVSDDTFESVWSNVKVGGKTATRRGTRTKTDERGNEPDRRNSCHDGLAKGQEASFQEARRIRYAPSRLVRSNVSFGFGR